MSIYCTFFAHNMHFAHILQLRCAKIDAIGKPIRGYTMGPFPHDAPPATISAHNPAGTDGFEFV